MPIEKPALRRIGEAATALWVAGTLLPIMLLGFTDDGLLASAAVAMALPSAAFCLFLLGDALARAFGPPVGAVVGLAIVSSRQMAALTLAAGRILFITIIGRR
ncbi:hypothetical protein [Xanthobacter sp. KR7-225]|uniref:hypothetical protein n=1 Tax=Xanthobacter sp. KR7-225 TaxID=3156613 RepID=UPI0032B3BCF8